MKKIVFFIPTILFTLLYGLIIMGTGLSVSPIVYVWIILFLISDMLLAKRLFWGGFFGMLPGIHFIYRSTQDTGQVLPIEWPAGIIVITFYLLCSSVVFYKEKHLVK